MSEPSGLGRSLRRKRLRREVQALHLRRLPLARDISACRVLNKCTAACALRRATSSAVPQGSTDHAVVLMDRELVAEIDKRRAVSAVRVNNSQSFEV